MRLLRIISPIFFGCLWVAAEVPAGVAISNLASWAALLHLPDLANYLTTAMANSTTAISNLASWAIQFHLLDLALHLNQTIDTYTSWVSGFAVSLWVVLRLSRLLREPEAVRRHGF